MLLLQCCDRLGHAEAVFKLVVKRAHSLLENAYACLSCFCVARNIRSKDARLWMAQWSVVFGPVRRLHHNLSL